jgi:hypothetical protein
VIIMMMMMMMWMLLRSLRRSWIVRVIIRFMWSIIFNLCEDVWLWMHHS